jgi:hypothetical protein
MKQITLLSLMLLLLVTTADVVYTIVSGKVVYSAT